MHERRAQVPLLARSCPPGPDRAALADLLVAHGVRPADAARWCCPQPEAPPPEALVFTLCDLAADPDEPPYAVLVLVPGPPGCWTVGAVVGLQTSADCTSRLVAQVHDLLRSRGERLTLDR